MGRAESPLASGDDRLLAFAEDLRRLRRGAGSPSYRELARRVHYSASALSQAANGRSLPTLALTLAFVNGCRGNEAVWRQRWADVDSHINASSRPQAAMGTAENDRAAGGSTSPSATPTTTHAYPATTRIIKGRSTRRGGRLTLILAATVTVAFAMITWRANAEPASHDVGLAVGHTPGTSAEPGPDHAVGAAEPIQDGSDPNRAGCGPDAVTMASTTVNFPASVTSGTIELRYSPHCQAAWARFSPSPTWNPGAGVMVTVWTIRPADQASRQFTAEFGGLSLFGDMLMTARGCIAAEATMSRGSESSPMATTPCWVFATPATPGHGQG